MTAEQIAAATGIDIASVRGIMEHAATCAPIVETGTVSVTTTEIAYCATCGRRTFHDNGACMTHNAPVKTRKRSRRR